MALQAKKPAILSRRHALTTGLEATAALVVMAVLPREATGAEVKLAKSLVQYTDAGRLPHMDCDDCLHFVPGRSLEDKGLCRIVEGDIAPHGHCLAFSPKSGG